MCGIARLDLASKCIRILTPERSVSSPAVRSLFGAEGVARAGGKEMIGAVGPDGAERRRVRDRRDT